MVGTLCPFFTCLPAPANPGLPRWYPPAKNWFPGRKLSRFGSVFRWIDCWGVLGWIPTKKILVWGRFLGIFFFWFFPHIFTFKRVVYWIAIYLCIYQSNICRVVPAMQGCPLAVGPANGEIGSHSCSISCHRFCGLWLLDRKSVV